MTKKQITIITLILFLSIISILILFIFNKSNTDNKFLSEDETQQQNTDDLKFISYVNEKYNFSLQYPEPLVVVENKAEQLDNKWDYVVNFKEDDEYGFSVASVSVKENTKFSSVNDWLDSENKQRDNERLQIDKKIKIAEQDAFVFFVHNNLESDDISSKSKITVFIKDGDLYKITTRFAQESEHENIWNSFKFEK